jgi:putative endonuclease
VATKNELGKLGEELAARFLHSAGYRILARNWRAAAGEVDLVVQRGDCLVICEVKTRRSLSHGHPTEAVNLQRISHLQSAVEQWLAENQTFKTGRVDVVSIVIGPPMTISHLQSVAA